MYWLYNATNSLYIFILWAKKRKKRRWGLRCPLKHVLQAFMCHLTFNSKRNVTNRFCRSSYPSQSYPFQLCITFPLQVNTLQLGYPSRRLSGRSVWEGVKVLVLLAARWSGTAHSVLSCGGSILKGSSRRPGLLEWNYTLHPHSPDAERGRSIFFLSLPCSSSQPAWIGPGTSWALHCSE